MTKQDFLKYCFDSYGTSPDYPFNEDFETAVLRHANNRKWYALVMKVSRRKFGLDSDEVVDVVNLKLPLEMFGSFGATDGVYPAYHMNKLHWISVLLPDVPEDVLEFLANVSYEATRPTTRKVKKPMENKGIQIYVVLKQIGSITKKVKEYPFFLSRTPRTFRELIEESVKSCVSAYKARANGAKNPAPLTDEQLDGMREIGKFAFGVHYNENDIDEANVIETALVAVTDGLVRVFKGNDEITDLDAEIEISEGDLFTFVRLTMLSSRMW